VRINTELSFDDLLAIYSSIRRYLGVKGSKKSTREHLDLHRMVLQMGGAPSGKGTVAFWTSAKAEWNNKHPERKYGTWKGVKIAYDRLHKKLNSRYLGRGVKGQETRP
jgi:hypothetical protein